MTWKELEPHRVITVGRTSGNRALIDNALAQQGQRLSWSYEVTHLSGSLGLVEAGLGVAVLPKLVDPAADHPLIPVIPLLQPGSLTHHRRRATPSGASLSPAAAQCFEMLLDIWKT